MSESILEEADRIISSARRAEYGPVEESFKKIATVWSMVLKHEVTPEDVALCMVGLKFCREANAPKRDNLVDMCGYAALLAQLNGTA